MSFFECPRAGGLFAWRDKLVVDAHEQIWMLDEKDVAAGGGMRQVLGRRAVALETPPGSWTLSTDGQIVWVEGPNANFLDLETGARRVLPIQEFVGAPSSTRDPKWISLEAALPLPFPPGLVYERARAVKRLYEVNDVVWGDGQRGTPVGDTGVVLRGERYYAVDAANKLLFLAAENRGASLWRLSGPGEPPMDWLLDGARKTENGSARDILGLAVGARGHIAVAYAPGDHRGDDEPPCRVHVGRTSAPRFESVGSVPCTSIGKELWLGWSPDGKTLAVVEAAGLRTSVRLLTADARVRSAFKVRGMLQGAAWASNGTALYIADATGIRVVKV